MSTRPEVNAALSFTIDTASAYDFPDAALESLLWRSYVEAGFTDPDVAREQFGGPAVRARGEPFFARSGPSLCGMIIVVPGNSPNRRFAAPDEAELHLLAVDPEWRGHGIGTALVRHALELAEALAPGGVVLWTQPEMHAARRIYTSLGFTRRTELDFERAGRRFWVHRLDGDDWGARSRADSTAR